MKIFFTILMLCALTTTLVMCNPKTTHEPINNPNKLNTQNPVKNKNKKSIVVYFSKSGNTQKIAEIIASETGSDIFRIQPATQYPASYDKSIEIGRKEKNTNARPKIIGKVANMEEYDRVYLGWPCWFGTCPMVIFTFIEEHNLKGKTIIPFTTHGGTGFGSSTNDIKKKLPSVKILEGISIIGAGDENTKKDIKNWLNKLKK